MKRRTSFYRGWRPQFFLWGVLGLLLCQLLPSNSAVAAPFLPGEKATYQVRWSFIVGGRVDIAVEKDSRINDTDVRHFSLTAKTYPLVDIFYKVRERIDSYTDKAVTHSLLYKKRQTGKIKRDITVSFDWRKNVATYRNFDEKPRTTKIDAGTFDPLSAYFFFRTLDLGQTNNITRPVTDGKKLVQGRARILRRERVIVPAGRFDTIVVEPDMKKVQGVFDKKKGARLLVWLTADSRHLLVKAESKVVVGAVVAELISYSGTTRP